MKNIFPKKEERAGELSQSLGVRGEQEAARYLTKHGFRILEKNYRVKGGEIDIIANDHHDLVFVEVKTRKSVAFGYPEESVSFTKELRIARAIRHYLMRFRAEPAYRVDIVSIVYTRGLTLPSEVLHIPAVLMRVEI
ncbi:MAG: YraN family protein [Patescibacteria group bacterium]